MFSLSFNEIETSEILPLSKNDFYIPSKPLFNSKLFIDLDIDLLSFPSLCNYSSNKFNPEELNDPSDTNTEGDSDFSNELEEKNYLSNELIKDLDSPVNFETEVNEKNDSDNIKLNNDINNTDNMANINIINSLISLAKDGYEFKPKNYKPEENEKAKKSNNNNNKFGNRFNKRRENKNDWVCSYCKNFNFSFRNRCNKCKASKEHSDKFINYNFVSYKL